ncbi:cholinephosphotransferase 1-like [Uloborus diversus]|uniref:cholinephosphotransferase 1-like n=1 Tax=Uloborus diversus TaxID=327109 RepID=UPI0024099AAF|nr:cholinephosphotransferase 1-like [Uloborus diversus]XP_054723740.1 cholinephosphotransferase 1-like [Uloborus diversus]
MFLTRDILSPIQLKRLSDHKYNSSGRTLLDPIVQPFWNWLVLKLPLWLAPNLMTITGLLINILTSVILIGYSPDGTQEAPRWTFVLCAIGLFIYQTLDALDGKQARRTGTSSPLGELFDHGCDSLSTVFVSLGVCIAVQLGTFPYWMFFQCFTAMTLFYVAHWQTYVSGTLRFGRFDVTEAQYTVMLIHLISALFGPPIWATRIASVYIEVKLLPVFVGIVAASFAFYSNITSIFTGGAGKNGSTIAGSSIFSPIIPLALVVVPAFVIYQKSVSNIYEHHPCLYILAFGMVASKVTNKLVIAHMTKSEVEYLDSVLVGPGMLFMNQYFNTFIDEYIVLWLCFVYSACNLLHYSTIVCRQICSHLHISLFTIVPQDSSKMEEEPSSLVSAPLLQNDGASETSDLISNPRSPSYQHPFLEDGDSVDEVKLDDEIP